MMNLRKVFWSHPGNGSPEKSESYGEWNFYLFAGRAGKKEVGVLRSEQRLTTPKVEQSSQDTRQSEKRAIRKFQSGRSNRNPLAGSYPFFAGLRFPIQTGQGE